MTVWLLSIDKFNFMGFTEFLKKHKDKIIFSSSRYIGYIGSEQLSVNYKKYKNKKPILVNFEERNLDVDEEEIKINIETYKITSNGKYIEEPNYLGVFSARGLMVSKYYDKTNITNYYLGKICKLIYEDIYNKKQ